MIKNILFVFLLLVSTGIYSQETWSLEKCVNYALENNLDVRQAQYNLESQDATVLQSKGQFLPSVNASAYYGYNFGQRIDPFTNQFAQSTVNTGNFNLSANWVLFSGLQNFNQLKQSEYSQAAGEYALKNAQYLTALAVTSSYLQILFNEEALNVADEQLVVTRLQVERTKKLVDAGSAPMGTLYDIEAQLAREELAQVEADNQLVLAYLSLKQLLRLPGDLLIEAEAPTSFDSASLVLPSSVDAVIQTAYDTYPSIKTSEYQLLSAEKSVSLSNGNMIPRLVLSGSVGTGYSGNAKDVVDRTFGGNIPIGFVGSTNDIVFSPTFNTTTKTQSFDNQVSNNFNQSLGLALSIPIFNQLTNRASVNRAKVNYAIAETSLEREKQKVRQDIEKAYADATAAFKKYKSTEKGMKSLQEAYDYAQKRFDVGMINAVDYNIAKTNLFRAQSDLVRAKFDYIFRIKILDFYQGKSLTL